MRMESGAGSVRKDAAAHRAAGQKGHSCSGNCGGLGPCATNTAHELAESLGRAVDARDQRLFQHSEVVADLSSLRWTVDHQDDLDHVRKLLDRLGPATPTSFDRFDLYRVCEQSGVGDAQPNHRRNEGMMNSSLDGAQGAG